MTAAEFLGAEATFDMIIELLRRIDFEAYMLMLGQRAAPWSPTEMTRWTFADDCRVAIEKHDGVRP